MLYRNLTVLLWRHSVSVKRQILNTCCEFAVPLFMCYLIYIMREELSSSSKPDKLRDALRQEPFSVEQKSLRIFYTPETISTRDLMSLVGKKLNLQPMNTLSDEYSNNVRGYSPLANASKISEFTTNLGPNEVLVVFHNVSRLNPLGKLKYSIRTKYSFKAVENLEFDITALNQIRQTGDEAEHELFIHLMWAIDSSFIEMLTGKRVMQRLSLKAFHRTKPPDAAKWLIRVVIILFFCNIAMMPIFITFTSRLLIERGSGVLELMNMMGVTVSALVLSHILFSCIPGMVYVIVGTIVMKTEPAIFAKSDGFLIFLGLFLHMLSLLCLGAVLSHLGRSVGNATLIAVLAYIMVAFVPLLILDTKLPVYAMYICGLLITILPFVWVLNHASIFEEIGSGLNFENIATENISITKSPPALVAYIISLVQIAIYMFLYWYIDNVVPGVYGSALPWNFLCKRSYWRKDQVIQSAQEPTTAPVDAQYFETPPTNREAGIKVINVTKDFPNQPGAVNNVTLDIYKDEITVLLGHNGAGKSTLISVITGCVGATMGRVLVNGYDISLQKEHARKHIGLCPQHNTFMDKVSVKEHVMFFTLLKHGTFAEARIESEKLLYKLDLLKKKTDMVSQLSGGMKRRLQLACALAGKANVLLLDEPTSGLDVETRHTLWDLFLSLRESNTVLLSTHFMEEADALGDRVAALYYGQLRCHATPMFLKRAIGTGYRVSFNTIDKPNEAAITSTIKSVVPEAEVRETNLKSISFNLPMSYAKNFPNLFSKLESKKSELGIESMGVGLTTLEEVFIKLCSGYDIEVAEKEANLESPTYQKLTGMGLYFRQMRELILRYLRFLRGYMYSQIIFGIILNTILLILICWVTNGSDGSDETLRTNFDMDSYPPNSSIMYKVPIKGFDLRKLREQYPRVHFEEVFNVDEAVFRAGQNNTKHNYLAAIDVNDTDAKVLYTDLAGSDAVALNFLSNLLAAQAQPRASGRTITVQNDQKPEFSMGKTEFNIIQWHIYVSIIFLTSILYFITLPCKEYVNGARLNHILAGCSPELHWIMMLLMPTFQTMCTYLVALVIGCMYLDTDNTLNAGSFLGALSIVVIVGVMAMLAFAYYITFGCTQNVGVYRVIGFNMYSAVLFPIYAKRYDSLKYFEDFLRTVIPQYTFYKVISNCVNVARFNSLCHRNKDKCPNTDAISEYYAGGKCCGSNSDPLCYYCMSNPSIGAELLILIYQTIFYMICVFLKQRGVCSKVWEYIININYKPPKHRCTNKNVIEEQEYVSRAIEQTRSVPDIMLVSDVHKRYLCCCKFLKAVKGVSFSVKKGECFGLLGVNGAGKSTMFQMLTVTHCATRGRFFANGHFLKIPCNKKYRTSLSYCPQFQGLDDFLTGRQNISKLLAFNGLNERDAAIETTAWIKLVDMQKYMDRLVTKYSGGCLRRLAAAAGLCTDAPVALLDEPTAGVDVSVRQAVWLAIRRALRNQRSIIITSHSLYEIEALCHRLAIMADGEIFALGSPGALRAAYAVGHHVTFKLKSTAEIDEDAAKRQVDELKRKIESKFNCTLKDEHKTMLNYHINEVIPYSRLFEEMMQLQSSSGGLIEDYSVSDTTLEEVFLSFAKPNEVTAKRGELPEKGGTKKDDDNTAKN